jgi:GNAT superfamily N-acetyltransferase
MSSPALDNPIWSSLSTEQAALARGTSLAKRYEADVAPFAAIESVTGRSSDELASIVAAEEQVYLVGVAPELDERWMLLSSSRIVQMVWQSEVHVPESDAEIEPLGANDREAMLALTAAVFPGFFRPRTPEMGRYFGIHKGSVLAAMAGERMYLRGFQEISAVCTHPDFTGRGYAARLIAHVTNLIRARGATPFLHVGEANARARDLYLRLGFVERVLLPMWSVRRTKIKSSGR